MSVTNVVERLSGSIRGEEGGRSRLDLRQLSMLGVLALIWIGFDIGSHGLFLSSQNLSNLAVESAEVGVLAVGMTFLLIAREIDLSVGSSVALVGIVAASLQANHGFSTVTAVAIAVLAGVIIGVTQGALVAFLNIPSFIVTLGGQLGLRGLGYVISQEQTLGPLRSSFLSITSSYLSRLSTYVVIALAAALLVTRVVRAGGGKSSGRILERVLPLAPIIVGVAALGWVSINYEGIPTSIVIMVAAIGAGGVVLTMTTFGRRVAVFGGNREAATYAGISRKKMILAIFAIEGLCFGIAGVMDVSRIGGSPPGADTGLELTVISACVIGGTSMFGGRGSVIGSLVGVVLLQSLINGMDLMGLSSNVELVTEAVILICAVTFDNYLQTRRTG